MGLGTLNGSANKTACTGRGEVLQRRAESPAKGVGEVHGEETTDAHYTRAGSGEERKCWMENTVQRLLPVTVLSLLDITLRALPCSRPQCSLTYLLGVISLLCSLSYLGVHLGVPVVPHSTLVNRSVLSS